MRFVYGAIAGWLWLTFLYNVCPTLDDHTTLISCAIVVAGAMIAGK